jgi:hypothetical protein
MSRHRLVNGLALVVAAVLLLAFMGTQANAALPPLPSGSAVDVPASNAEAIPEPAFNDDALFVGQGSATGGDPMSPAIIELTSYSDFQYQVKNPSPALHAAAYAYFTYGGNLLWVQLTTDESAATLGAALASSTGTPGQFGSVVVPALGRLSGSGYLSVAAAADQLAAKNHAIALLDPADEVVSQAINTSSAAPLTAMASQLVAALPTPGSAILLFSGLLDDQGNAVSAGALVAGFLVASDIQYGVAHGLGGLDQTTPGLRPVWSIANANLPALSVAGINSFRTVAGYGTVLWGDVLLDGRPPQPGAPAVRYLNVRRILDQIILALPQLTAPYGFQANDAQTWTQVSSVLNSYLYSLWQSGEFPEWPSTDAYQVSVGLGSTMTAQDIQDGRMNVSVVVAPEFAWEPITITSEQAMTPIP